MASTRLNQPVHPGDLILAYSAKWSHMLVAKIGSDEPNPPTSAIAVDIPGWSPSAEPGHWTLSGPEVYYTEREDGNDDGDDEAGSEKTMTEETSESNWVPLDECLEELREDCQGNEQEISIIVNPHGR